MSFLKGKKTVIFFVLTLLVAIASMFGYVDYQPSGEEAEVIAVVLSLVGLGLRLITNTAPFQKK